MSFNRPHLSSLQVELFFEFSHDAENLNEVGWFIEEMGFAHRSVVFRPCGAMSFDWQEGEGTLLQRFLSVLVLAEENDPVCRHALEQSRAVRGGGGDARIDQAPEIIVVACQP